MFGYGSAAIRPGYGPQSTNTTTVDRLCTQSATTQQSSQHGKLKNRVLYRFSMLETSDKAIFSDVLFRSALAFLFKVGYDFLPERFYGLFQSVE
jgi:hypothetical protein